MSQQSVAPHSLGSAMERLSGKWGWIVAFGVALCIFGALALVFVVSATIASVYVNGIMMIMAGAAEIALGIRAKDWSRFFLWVLGGLLYIVAGAVAIWQPIVASFAFTLIIGAGLIAAGVVRLYLAFQLPPDQPRGLVILGAIVTLLFGVYIIWILPVASLFLLGVMLGVDLIFQGAGWIAFGMALKRRHGG